MPYEVKGDLNCWIWTGRTRADGTPSIRTATKHTTARRYYWERENGQIPEGKILAALCGEARCVRVLHAEPVTWEEWCRITGRSKLTLRSAGRAVLMRNAGMTQSEVANILDVSERTIRDIENGVHWTIRNLAQTRDAREPRNCSWLPDHDLRSRAADR